jgi:midasin
MLQLAEDGKQSAFAITGRILRNLAHFYDSFAPRITTFLSTERARIDKDVKNLIKLASWKDVNVYALRQSAIRSHHQLFKSVRKLREVLQKPASDFFAFDSGDKSLQNGYVHLLGGASV